MGAEVIDAPEPNLRPDVDEILRAITPATRMVVIATPNNPVGQYITRDELQRLRDSMDDDIMLIVDAAYGDYVSAEDYASGRELVEAGTNTIMTRTFSKLYGLSGLRIGWLLYLAGYMKHWRKFERRSTPTRLRWQLRRRPFGIPSTRRRFEPSMRESW